MNLTRVAIENNRTTWVLLIVMLVAGVSAYYQLPRDYDPGFLVRMAQVVTTFPGASPERVEQLVTDKLEKVIQEIPELDSVVSESRTGISIIKVNIQERYTDLRPIWDNLRRKIDAEAKNLPEGVVGPFVNDEFGDVFGIVLSVTGEGFDFAEMKTIADDVRDALLRLPQTSKVELFGNQDEQIFVDFDPVRLSEMGLTPFHLMQTLSGRNVVVPGGAIYVADERIVLEPSGNYENLEAIQRTLIEVPGKSSLIYLGDIAEVHRGYVEPVRSAVHASGAPALAIAVSMRKGGNIIALGESVARTVQQLTEQYPIGIEIQNVLFSPHEVDRKVQAFVVNLMQAIAVVAAVMLLSLGMRTGLVVAALIPSSMIMALLVMSFFHIGLNQISLAALMIALGMLVDNGIVMTENIVVKMKSGQSPLDAAIGSATELRVPLLTASLTTAAAFLPIYLAQSNTGEYTAPLFEVVSITLLSSWVLSMTVIPMLCVYCLKVKVAPASAHQGGADVSRDEGACLQDRVLEKYRSVLVVLLRHRVAMVIATVLVFGFSIYCMRWVPQIFFPPSDRMYFKMELELPLGASLQATEKLVEGVEAYLREDTLVNEVRTQGVTSWITYIGNGGPRFVLTHIPKPNSSHYALFIINTTSLKVIDEVMDKLNRHVWQFFPDATIKLKRFENGEPIENPVEIRVSGDNVDVLLRLAESIKEQLKSMNRVTSIVDDWGHRTKKISLHIDQDQVKRLGISNKDIALSMQTNLSGLALSQFRENDDIIPIVMRSEASEHLAVNQLGSLTVYSQQTGKAYSLSQVAQPVLEWESAAIRRRNLERTVTVGAQVLGDNTAISVLRQLEPWLHEQQKKWPRGYHYELGGEMETSQKANESIVVKLPIAAFIILILLVGQFNSIRRPLIILTTIPLGVAGVIFGLLLFRSYFGFMTLLGIISLSGIVINNAIVLIERIQLEHHDNGVALHEAIIVAAQRRLRPILLTTATTVLGLIPLYWGGGEMWEPMAVAIMVGLLFSTVLTLGLVPVLYALLFGVSYKHYKFAHE